MDVQRSRKRSTVTIRDIALAAGVSVSTVSRVLNNKGDVAQETSAKIQRVIEESGYISSLAARSMRSYQTNVIGLVLPDVRRSFSIQVMRGVHAAAEELSYDLIVYSSATRCKSENERVLGERQSVLLLNGGLTDGTVVVTPRATDFPVSSPVVAVDPSGRGSNVPSVIARNREGALAAMKHLLDLGHRRIGFIGGRPDLQSALRRLQGYKDSLAQAGVEFDPDLVQTGDYTRATAVPCAQRLLSLSNPPTAIFAANDQSAVGVIEVANQLGVRIPEDLSLVGFDNIPEASQVTPRLTTVDQSIETMGYIAIHMLVKLIRGEPLENALYKVPTHLVIRESCQKPGSLA